jgi:simple sugar transport system substrate-binding protein
MSVISFASFGGAAAQAQEKPGEGMYFVLVTHGGDDPFFSVVNQGMKDAAALLGAKADIVLAGTDLATELRKFNEAVAAGADGIAVVINDAQAWDQPMADAIAKGVPVIGIVDDDPDGDQGSPRLFFVGQRGLSSGNVLGTRLFEEAKKKGVDLTTAKVVMAAEVPAATYAQVRAAGVKSAMAEYGIPESNFELIDSGVEKTIVEERLSAYLIAHPDTTFLIGAGGLATEMLEASLKAAGLQAGDVIAGGFDVAPGTLEGIESGYVTASIDQQQYLAGFMGVMSLYLYKQYGLMPDVNTGRFVVDSPEKAAQIKALSGTYR